MEDAKVVSISLGSHFKLSIALYPEDDDERGSMSITPYASVVGSLMFSMICTRPHLSFSASLVSKFMANPEHEYWVAVKYILRYVKATLNVGLIYDRGLRNGNTVCGYVYADHVSGLDKRRSRSGYAFTVLGNVVSWKSTLQHVLALSMIEFEYIA